MGRVDRRRRRLPAGAAAAFVALAIGLFLSLGFILSAPADRPAPSDLLVILGGGVGDRVVKGHQLLSADMAGTVLLTGVWREQVIDRFTSFDYRIKYLEERGISRQQIHIDAVASSSWEEALLIRDFMRDNQFRSALVVSDPPHIRRLSLLVRKVFADSGLTLRLVPSEPDWWHAGRWWQNRRSASFVVSEIAKLVYYASQARI
jgi:uncharacterized SAM-binding protein YcdF (DUF218 family)